MIDLVIPTREVSLVGDMKVRRILPFRERRMVGPFTFLDEMGPFELTEGGAGDVPPHPHIGLSTVTYLFEGEVFHRDSLGSEQAIIPGDVNWMTAGSGIVHSERIPAGMRSGGKRLHGLQAWVALPTEFEETAPVFDHYPKEDLPRFNQDGVEIRLIAGSAFGRRSPVRTHSLLFYLEAKIPEGRALDFDPEMQESAFYLVSGRVAIEERIFEAPVMVAFKPGEAVKISAQTDAHGVLLGGEPLDGHRFIFWNFVSSSRDRLEAAKKSWREGEFPRIPGETEFVPLPGETGG